MRHILLPILFLSACSSGPTSWVMIDAQGQAELDVMLDTDSLSPAEKAAAVDAAGRWEAAVPVRVHLVIAPCTGSYSTWVCVREGTAPEAASDDPRSEAVTTPDGTVRVYTARIVRDGHDPTELYPVILAHELGHVMGLSHSGPGHLMSADGKTATPRPTALDVANWHRANG